MQRNVELLDRASHAMSDVVSLFGVTENNLKNLDLEIPHNELVVVTGVSGSGKSTLAFDTLYAEGGRRYIETFSPYTRQFLDRLHQPKLDRIEGVRPALALEQRNRVTSSRSTVGTATEINEYLKLIWSALSDAYCPKCGEKVEQQSPAQVASAILSHEPDSVLVLFPVKVSASAEAIRATLQASGFVRFYSAPGARRLDELNDSDLSRVTELLVVVDRISGFAEKGVQQRTHRRLISSVAQAFDLGHGRMQAVVVRGAVEDLHPFESELRCPKCSVQLPRPRPSMFSFNSALGACRECNGFGRVLNIDPNLCVPDPTRSIDDGAVQCWSGPARKKEVRTLKAFCAERGIRSDVPWGELPKKERDLLFFGLPKGFKGINGWFEKLKRKRHKMHVRVFLSRYRSESLCPRCGGGRLEPDASLFKVRGRTLREAWQAPLADLAEWFASLTKEYESNPIAEIALDEVLSRLRYLDEIGLGYLTLDRQSKTLSGGESQRVNLTSILGSRLVNTMLVLDEPTIGLHSRDTGRLIGVLENLRDRGNSVVVVEHEPEVMRSADQIIDIGPRAGSAGGEIVFQGELEKLLSVPSSLTARYLAGKLEVSRKKRSVVSQEDAITLRGASVNNLKGLTVSIPLHAFVVVTGVSGSGKSSLVHECLAQTAARKSLSSLEAIENLDAVKRVVLIDQSPVGKTPRSNPATYTKVWDIIRDILSETPRAQELGLSRSAFSFNVPGGRCQECEGAGQHRIEMQFLADVFVECERCGGSRFQESVLSVTYAGRNVQDLLRMSLDEVVDLFSRTDARAIKVAKAIEPLTALGLGYMRLGQPLNEVSGGEAQRIKLARYLTDESSGECLFILDEPTTGLHPYNINALLQTFDRLIERGHSVLCVEHNLDVIRSADWMIDLGPGGGEAGGHIVCEGPPAKLLEDSAALERSLTLQEFVRERTLKKCKALRATPPKAIAITGARHHNLQNISVQIPYRQLTVMTGVSGSGKSTLAFDILFQEGQRRFIDCLSPYARQYLTHIKRAEVDRVEGIPPTIAVSQKTAPPHGISTIATTTEIYQFLRLLYSKAGTQHCPDHDLPIESFSVESICDEIESVAGSRRVFLYAPVVSGRKGHYADLFERALRAEIEEARVDGKVIRISQDLKLERHRLHWISLLAASFSGPKRNREMLRGAVEQALVLGGGTIELALEKKDAELSIFSTERVCPKCRRGFRELDPQDFSFRSARGVCSRCGGRGVLGGGESKRAETTCSECEGMRIGHIGRHVYVNGRNIHQMVSLTAPALLDVVETLVFPERMEPVVRPVLRELTHRLKVIADVGLDYLELDRDASTISGGEAQRLRLARTLGSPLTGVCYVLDEPTIGLHPNDHELLMRLLRELRDRGNTVVVVEHDEDTIAAADHIIDLGPGGGANGGSIVASGTFSTILQSKESITAAELRIRLERGEGVSARPPGTLKKLQLTGASANNLQNVVAEFPLGALTVVCGLSGAGKSSLVHQSLVPAVMEVFEGSKKKKRSGNRTWNELKNHETIERLLEIDQRPVGRTPASTPASFLGIFDEMRKVFALIPEARTRGWTASHFSFNSGKGRCATCGGKGYLKVPMSFLPDAVSECEDCRGMRYTDETLDVLFQGLSIGEVLQKTMTEAREIFVNFPRIRRSLDYVHDLGIGYLTLGQPTNTLSGGEAQRLKIARELGSRQAENTLYILDEPTVGLHLADVSRLLAVLRKLIAKGNTVVVIEHHLDVIRAADQLIELGPGPGRRGGEIIFSGPPEELRTSRINSPTKRALARGFRAFGGGPEVSSFDLAVASL